MNIGDKIIDQIVLHGLVHADPQEPKVLVWSGDAAERIAEVVAQERDELNALFDEEVKSNVAARQLLHEARQERDDAHAELEQCQQLANTFQRERDEARKELSEWKTLMAWGGTPEIVDKFIRGQQSRIHAAQDVERERDEARASSDAAHKRIHDLLIENDNLKFELAKAVQSLQEAKKLG